MKGIPTLTLYITIIIYLTLISPDVCLSATSEARIKLYKFLIDMSYLAVKLPLPIYIPP